MPIKPENAERTYVICHARLRQLLLIEARQRLTMASAAGSYENADEHRVTVDGLMHDELDLGPFVRLMRGQAD